MSIQTTGNLVGHLFLGGQFCRPLNSVWWRFVHELLSSRSGNLLSLRVLCNLLLSAEIISAGSSTGNELNDWRLQWVRGGSDPDWSASLFCCVMYRTPRLKSANTIFQTGRTSIVIQTHSKRVSIAHFRKSTKTFCWTDFDTEWRALTCAEYQGEHLDPSEKLLFKTSSYVIRFSDPQLQLQCESKLSSQFLGLCTTIPASNLVQCQGNKHLFFPGNDK